MVNSAMQHAPSSMIASQDSTATAMPFSAPIAGAKVETKPMPAAHGMAMMAAAMNREAAIARGSTGRPQTKSSVPSNFSRVIPIGTMITALRLVPIRIASRSDCVRLPSA